MGVLTDYFRATDEASVVKVLTSDEQPSKAFDLVEAKGIDPIVVLGRLVAAAREVPFEAGLVAARPVWPVGPQPWAEGATAAFAEDDPWVTGPWVMELADDVRETLAGIRASDLPELAERWARTAELQPVEPDELRPLIKELALLARRARTARQHLYCRVCV
ncbi:hypothetical protein AB0K51_07720 [Kitasatospora sp. NPDC049285]|uniref:hypothetical protein n=1 Tax=Kitasatospora sp. NPDC049285 TaxID=3157096 RepID=UPI0034400E78